MHDFSTTTNNLQNVQILRLSSRLAIINISTYELLLFIIVLVYMYIAFLSMLCYFLSVSVLVNELNCETDYEMLSSSNMFQ